MKFETSYIASNCNEIPKIADWGKNNLICYGSCDSVMVYDPKYCGGGKVTRTLVGHLKRVNTVKWLSGNDVNKETEIVSGSADHTVVVWTLEKSDYKSVTLEGHTSNVNIVDGYYKENEKRFAVVVSVGTDNTVRVWIRILPEGNFALHQTINLGDHLAVGLRLLFLPNFNQFLLACGLDNSKILLYTEHEEHPVKFVEATQLIGHEDWVRDLDFTKDGNDFLLASCSQDTFIRIWRITTTAATKEGHFCSPVKQCLTIKSKQFYVYLESLLTGHEGWIYSVRWSPKNLQLLSASIDKSMILWQCDETTGMWVEKMRLGVVGGNIMGFYGGLFSSKGDHILGHSYHGAFHIWKRAPESNEWTPCTTIGGHSAEVVDCAWEPEGEFLFTCGADQTTRIHAPWSSQENEVTWHEIARPQIHGYDISSIAVISRYKYASAAEEKVIRVFEAPINFVENFRRLCRIQADPEGDLVVRSHEQLPQGASVPSLGLSNKAVYGPDNSEIALVAGTSSMYPEESHFQATFLTEPPTEETLLQNTLWPEVQKLYGHGYEVYSLAASPDQKFLASACKSTQLEHANILLWDVPSWKIVQTLPSHTLTVVQLQFSPNSSHLLSVSRDRRWTLFSKNENGNFEQTATTDKNTGVHNRIIWTCSWTHDSKFFVTGSRDGKVVVWTINEDLPPSPILGKCQRISEILEYPNDSVTAVAFAPILVEDGYMLAVGLEFGTIHIFLWRLMEWKKVLVLRKGIAHHQAVKKLAFRPVVGKAGIKVCNKNVLQLASCGADNSVKIFDIYV